MNVYAIRHSESGALVGDRVKLADGPWSRIKGLAGRQALTEGEGLMLTPCQAVHMYGVRFPIDVVFLDESYTVVATYEGLEPGTRTHVYRDARHALKLPLGTLNKIGLGVGDRLQMERTQ